MGNQVESNAAVDANLRLGARVRKLRTARKLTLDALSQKCDVSRASISKIERGEMSPTYETLRKLANGLEVALTTLVVGPPLPRA